MFDKLTISNLCIVLERFQTQEFSKHKQDKKPPEYTLASKNFYYFSFCFSLAIRRFSKIKIFISNNFLNIFIKKKSYFNYYNYYYNNYKVGSTLTSNATATWSSCKPNDFSHMPSRLVIPKLSFFSPLLRRSNPFFSSPSSSSSSSSSSMVPPPILALALPSETGRVLSIQSHTVQVP